jgi:hypothetical protein
MTWPAEVYWDQPGAPVFHSKLGSRVSGLCIFATWVSLVVQAAGTDARKMHSRFHSSAILRDLHAAAVILLLDLHEGMRCPIRLLAHARLEHCPGSGLDQG